MIAYTVDDTFTGEKGKKVDRDYLESKADEVSNAHLVNNHGFVANKGSHIDTEVDYSKLGVHSYIDYNKLYDFSDKMSLKSIYEAITKEYTIKNVDYDYDEAMEFIVDILYDDYSNHRINYLAYIEKDIDARLFFELRRNALLRFRGAQMEEFCKAHSEFTSQEEVKAFRLSSVKAELPEYEDLDWQYALLIKELWGLDIMNFYFDLEVCFEDRKTNYQRTPEDYKREFVWAKTSLLRDI